MRPHYKASHRPFPDILPAVVWMPVTLNFGTKQRTGSWESGGGERGGSHAQRKQRTAMSVGPL